MSKPLNSDTLIKQPNKTVEETNDKTITMHECVEVVLVRLLPIIEELRTFEVPIRVIDSLRQEWITLDRVHENTKQKD